MGLSLQERRVTDGPWSSLGAGPTGEVVQGWSGQSMAGQWVGDDGRDGCEPEHSGLTRLGAFAPLTWSARVQRRPALAWVGQRVRIREVR